MDKQSADLGNENDDEMVAQNNYDPINPNASGNVDETDLQEMQAVNESLDQLSNALDFFEERTDNIIEQLKELLHSNREIRQELAEENATAEGTAMEENEPPAPKNDDNKGEEES